MLVVYDVSNPASFEKIPQWVDDIERYATNTCAKLLVANKVDLVSERKVSVEQGSAMAAQLQLQFYDTSAKTGQNVERVFTDLATACLAKENPTKARSIVGLSAVPEKKKSKFSDCELL